MNYRRLGKTELNVSAVGVGTWQLGGEWGKVYEQSEVDRMIRRAGELDINLIHTAECYGDHTSEELVGNAIKGQREDWIVATKFGHKFHANFERTTHFEPVRCSKTTGRIAASLYKLITLIYTNFILGQTKISITRIFGKCSPDRWKPAKFERSDYRSRMPILHSKSRK